MCPGFVWLVQTSVVLLRTFSPMSQDLNIRKGGSSQRPSILRWVPSAWLRTELPVGPRKSWAELKMASKLPPFLNPDRLEMWRHTCCGAGGRDNHARCGDRCLPFVPQHLFLLCVPEDHIWHLQLKVTAPLRWLSLGSGTSLPFRPRSDGDTLWVPLPRGTFINGPLNKPASNRANWVSRFLWYSAIFNPKTEVPCSRGQSSRDDQRRGLWGIFGILWVISVKGHKEPFFLRR